ncbi:MAG: hypothetical protein RR420_00810 [Anaerovoracaceae bacterium]
MSKENNNQPTRELSGLGIAGVGGGIIHSQLKKGNLTGRETLYHNTKNEYVDSIMKDGVRSDFARDPNKSVTMQIDDLKDLPETANKAYFGRNKSIADSVGAQRTKLERIKEGKGRFFADPIQEFAESKLHNKTLKANVPTWKLNEVDNPEWLNLNRKGGAKHVKEIMGKMYPLMSETEKSLNAHKTLRDLGRKGTATFEGGVGPEYIKNSSKYKQNSVREIVDYAKNNKKRFTKSLGKSVIGTGLIGAGSTLIYSGLGKKNKQENREKKACYVEAIFEKVAEELY